MARKKSEKADNDSQTPINQKVKFLIDQFGFSQTALAAKAGVTDDFVSRLVNKPDDPSYSKLLAVANVFPAPYRDWLLYGDPSRPPGRISDLPEIQPSYVGASEPNVPIFTTKDVEYATRPCVLIVNLMEADWHELDLLKTWIDYRKSRIKR